MPEAAAPAVAATSRWGGVKMRTTDVTRATPVLVLGLAVMAVDVLSKVLAEALLDEPVDLLAGLQLDLGHNSGVAFGVLDASPVVVLVTLGLAVLMLMVLAIARGWLWLPWPILGLLAGGATANLVDRIVDGRVTDFIDPPHWPAFNVADIAITLAVTALLLRGDTAIRPSP